MTKRRILIVVNDSSICHAIEKYMQDRNTDIYCTTSPVEALGHFLKTDYNLAIVGIHLLEEVNTIYMMRAVKKTPILVFGAPLGSDEKVSLFQAGADAYIETPLDMDVCRAQANALIELYSQSSSNPTQHSPIIFGTKLLISPLYRRVLVNGNPLSLTRKEFDLLYYLASYPEQVFSKEQLYHQVWQDDSVVDGSGTVKTHIKTLRKKLGVAGEKYIQNIWGIGYKFTTKPLD